ncbi:MAG TPA: multidrug effflux MFS transporter [Beijerinckiaceae bacterium]|jgi:DHA1 family bicyclomycin/chloramphenicol resistance-like MFS transporter
MSEASIPPRPPLAVLVAISALQPFALNVLAPATPGLARSFSTDYATIQLTLTLYLVAVAMTQLVVGPISDRIGRRPCVIAALALFMAGSLMGALAGSIPALLAARVVQAMGGGTCFALSRAIVRDTSSKNEAASLIGYITMAMVVSPMVAPLAGGFLDASLGWRSIFVAMLGMAAPVALGAYAYLGETARREGAAASLSAMAAAMPVLVADRRFLGYTLSLSFTTAAFFVFIAGAPYVVVETMGREPHVYGLYFIVNAAGYMSGNFLTGRFGQRLGSERLIAIGTALSVASVAGEAAVVALGPWTPATLFLPLAFNAVGNGLTIPGGTALALSVRPDLAGTAAGIVGATQLGLGALGSVIVGHTVLAWPPSLVAIMLACVVTGWVALRLARTRPVA